MPDKQLSADSMERYRRSAGKAQVADLLAKITGASTDLISYDAVANRLRARQQIEMGTRMVPLEQIVGSVGRYRDFTRSFLPRAGISPERWARVDAIMHSLEGYLPIELYKIGEVYFVRDGNHRVSVARANGLTHIEAYVTEIETDVDLTLDDFERDQWIIKIERSDFIKRTNLDELRPHNHVVLTAPGRYRILLRHIAVHQYFRNLDLERAGSEQRLTWTDAVVSWYDNVYLPVVESIREHDLLAEFSNRTETDLYLWIAFHREELARRFELAPLSADAAVRTFARVHSDNLLQQAFKTVTLGFRRTFGDGDIPLGMTEAEFDEARARYAAGERTIAEAEADRRNAAGEALTEEEGRYDDEAFDGEDLAGVTPLPAVAPSVEARATAFAGAAVQAAAQVSAEQASAGQAGAGQPAAGQAPTGQAAVTGQASTGGDAAEQPAAEHLPTGQAATAQAATGQAATGQAATGQSATGQAATGQPPTPQAPGDPAAQPPSPEAAARPYNEYVDLPAPYPYLRYADDQASPF